MKRYILRIEMDTLFAYLLENYGISLSWKDLQYLEKIAYMKEDDKGDYIEFEEENE